MMQRSTLIHTSPAPLPLNLKCHLEAVIDNLSVSSDIAKIAIHFCDTSYYHRREGLHPVIMQCEREKAQPNNWHINFITSLSYQDEIQKVVTSELHFNFKQGWFYQPDIGKCVLAQPLALALFQSWGLSFARQIGSQRFDDIYLKPTNQ